MALMAKTRTLLAPLALLVSHASLSDFLTHRLLNIIILLGIAGYAGADSYVVG